MHTSPEHCGTHETCETPARKSYLGFNDDLTMAKVQEGFAYIVANRYGHEFLLSATIAKSKTKSKKFLGFLQNQRCRAGVPMLEPIALAKVTMTIESIEREL